jgi:C1A family cysteine protease
MRANLLLLISLFFAISLHCQNFVGVSRSEGGQTIILYNDQVLEIKLPCQPSTGYAWYATDINKEVITRTGDWDFISEEMSGKVGQAGTEIIRFTGVSEGTTELTLEYKRPWEKNKIAEDIFKVTVISKGKYTGNFTPPVKSQTIEKKKHPLGSSAFPSSFSWQPFCSPVKDQAKCGACWSFATTGSFEAIVNIIDHNMRSFSEQWLINCVSGEYGCQGGFCPNQYLVSEGAVYENDFPYTNASCYTNYGNNAQCIGICGTNTHHEKPDSARYVNMINNHAPSDEMIKQAIYNYGPVWANLCALNNFNTYKRGVLINSDGKLLNHAVVLVGWKDSTMSNGSSGYWILKNSWGPSTENMAI